MKLYFKFLYKFCYNINVRIVEIIIRNFFQKWIYIFINLFDVLYFFNYYKDLNM